MAGLPDKLLGAKLLSPELICVAVFHQTIVHHCCSCCIGDCARSERVLVCSVASSSASVAAPSQVSFLQDTVWKLFRLWYLCSARLRSWDQQRKSARAACIRRAHSSNALYLNGPKNMRQHGEEEFSCRQPRARWTKLCIELKIRECNSRNMAIVDVDSTRESVTCHLSTSNR